MSRPYFSLPEVAAVEAALGAESSRFAVNVVESCASTNSVLSTDTPLDDGRTHVLVAQRQSAGRGRRGRVWSSWPGMSLTFSSLWWFDPGAPVPAGLSLVAGVAVARCFESLGLSGLQLKWPNDVLVFGDKLAGILVELLPGRGRTPAAVVGIGINLSLPASRPAELSGVTSLADHLTVVPPASEVLARVLLELQRAFAIYGREGFTPLREAWELRNAYAGLPVNISGEGVAMQGVCEGVDDDGALLLRTGDAVQRVLSGELSLRPLS